METYEYLLVRELESGTIERLRRLLLEQGGGSFSMATFDLYEQESPVVLAKRLQGKAPFPADTRDPRPNYVDRTPVIDV